MVDSEIIKLLEQIKDELSLLTVDTKIKAITQFYKDFLTTNQKQAIYESFDGEKDSNQISQVTGIPQRTVQQVIKDLEEHGLIEVKRNKNSKVPIKSIGNIALYYARKNFEQVIKKGGTGQNE